MAKRSRQDDDISTVDEEAAKESSGSPAKMIELDMNDSAPITSTRMQCYLPPHRPLTFASAEDFDVHYAKEHTNRCSECGKNFPSAHYMSLHFDENHNPIREVLAAKGEKTYACFIDDCEKLCSTPQKRRLHLIDKHMFPKVYNFRIVDQGIDRTDSLLQTGQRRRVSTADSSGHRRRSSLIDTTSATTRDQKVSSSAQAPSSHRVSPVKGAKDNVTGRANEDLEVDELEQSFAALKFVPPSVQARHRHKKST